MEASTIPSSPVSARTRQALEKLRKHTIGVLSAKGTRKSEEKKERVGVGAHGSLENPVLVQSLQEQGRH